MHFKNTIEMNPQIRNIIFNNSEKLIYKKGEIIVKAGEILKYVYYINKGRIRYIKLRDDGTKEIGLTDTNIIGLIPVIRGCQKPRSDIISETESEVYAIKINTFFSLMDSSTIFRDYIMKKIAVATSNSITKCSDLKHYTKKDLFISFLEENIDTNHSIDGDWYKLNKYYTQQEYADFFGVSRITIYTIIKNLCEEGRIRQINNEIQIKICNDNND